MEFIASLLNKRISGLHRDALRAPDNGASAALATS